MIDLAQLVKRPLFSSGKYRVFHELQEGFYDQFEEWASYKYSS